MHGIFKRFSAYTIVVLLTLVAAILPASCAAEKLSPDQALGFVCHHLNVDCSELKTPEVVYHHGFHRPDVLGVFVPSAPEQVHLRYELLRPDRAHVHNMVLVHEVTHYVDFHLGLVDPSRPAASCYHEELAWFVSNIYALAAHIPVYQNWPQAYGCYR